MDLNLLLGDWKSHPEDKNELEDVVECWRTLVGYFLPWTMRYSRNQYGALTALSMTVKKA